LRRVKGRGSHRVERGRRGRREECSVGFAGEGPGRGVGGSFAELVELEGVEVVSDVDAADAALFERGFRAEERVGRELTGARLGLRSTGLGDGGGGSGGGRGGDRLG
jgi:hypothetical protein